MQAKVRTVAFQGIDVLPVDVQVMIAPGKSVQPQELAAEAAHLMEKHSITALPVVDAAGTLVGALNVHDLLRAGVL